MGNESCILQVILQRNKQLKMKKRFHDLQFCGLLRGNKQPLRGGKRSKGKSNNRHRVVDTKIIKNEIGKGMGVRHEMS